MAGEARSQGTAEESCLSAVLVSRSAARSLPLCSRATIESEPARIEAASCRDEIVCVVLESVGSCECIAERGGGIALTDSQTRVGATARSWRGTAASVNRGPQGHMAAVRPWHDVMDEAMPPWHTRGASAVSACLSLSHAVQAAGHAACRCTSQTRQASNAPPAQGGPPLSQIITLSAAVTSGVRTFGRRTPAGAL